MASYYATSVASGAERIEENGRHAAAKGGSQRALPPDFGESSSGGRRATAAGRASSLSAPRRHDGIDGQNKQSFYAQDQRRRNRELRDHLRSQQSVGQIFDIAAERGEFWDAIGLSMALHASAWKARSSGETFDFSGDARWKRVRELLREKIDNGEARNLANNIWSLASMVCTDRPLLREVAERLREKALLLNSQELSNSSWAFATLKWVDQPLFEALAEATLANSTSFSHQDVANTLWAFATVLHQHTELFTTLGEEATARSRDFKPQELANAIWAAATIMYQYPPLVHAVSEQASKSFPEFRTQNLANFVWAYAKLAFDDRSVLNAVLQEAKGRLSYFSQQDLTTTAWAFSTALLRDDRFLEDCLAAFRRRTTNTAGMRPQHASNLLWAMAAVSFQSQGDLDFLSDAVCFRSSEFKPQELANSIWAFATLHVRCDPLVVAVSSELTTKAPEFSTQSLSNFVWAYAKLNHADATVIRILENAASEKLPRYSEQDLSTTAWAFGAMQHRNDPFLKRWVATVKGKAWIRFAKAQHVSNMLWSFATVLFYDAELFTSLAGGAIPRLSEFKPQDLACIGWACATVKHQDASLTDALAMETTRRVETFDAQSVGMMIWAVADMSTKITAVYDSVWRRLRVDESILQWDEKVFAEVVSALLRSDNAGMAWAFFERLTGSAVDPGVNALAALLHHGRHVEPILERELRVFLCLARYRQCRHLTTIVLNTAALRLLELRHETEAQALLLDMDSLGLGDFVTGLARKRAGLPDMGAGGAPGRSLRYLDASFGSRGLAARCSYDKECQLCRHVLASAEPNNPDDVIAAIERFSFDGNGWLKIAGDGKGAVLDDLIQTCPSSPPRLAIEFGCYVGYSSTRMARWLRRWGGRFICVEVDPIHVCVTRCVHEFAGVADSVSIYAGYSEDAIPRLRAFGGDMPADVIFMDQRGTRFHLDLEALEDHQVVAHGCIVAADNVLKPGAPHFLWHMQISEQYESTVVSLREFASEKVEDWMSVARYDATRLRLPVGLPPPEAMSRLTFLTDRIRQRACASNGHYSLYTVSEDDWSRHAQDMRQGFAEAGIKPYMAPVRRREDGTAYVDWGTGGIFAEPAADFVIKRASL
eukprot:TRINITY_DN121258_c0_g1_i1.p1 TRINITY_DN121258_c0_g1~~TRINITY_DN121258_c0_g1_i1.p1  ORF type:complete len:1112 (+),score=186.56 TRINITY_DN121258_c0_g1_i1:79-3414(+)